eukprot:scaffold160299_cov66-Attheya_sp.AAC.4
MVKVGLDKSTWIYITTKAVANCCLVRRRVPFSLHHRWTLKLRENKMVSYCDSRFLCGILGETTTVNVRAMAPAPKEEQEEIEVRDLKREDFLNTLWRDQKKERSPLKCGLSAMVLIFGLVISKQFAATYGATAASIPKRYSLQHNLSCCDWLKEASIIACSGT